MLLSFDISLLYLLLDEVNAHRHRYHIINKYRNILSPCIVYVVTSFLSSYLASSQEGREEPRLNSLAVATRCSTVSPGFSLMWQNPLLTIIPPTNSARTIAQNQQLNCTNNLELDPEICSNLDPSLIKRLRYIIKGKRDILGLGIEMAIIKFVFRSGAYPPPSPSSSSFCRIYASFCSRKI